MLTFSRFGQKLIEKPLKLLSRQTLINTGTIVERYWNPNLPKGENMIKRTIVNRSIRSPLTIAGIDYFELSNLGGKKVLKAFGEKNCPNTLIIKLSHIEWGAQGFGFNLVLHCKYLY